MGYTHDKIKIKIYRFNFSLVKISILAVIVKIDISALGKLAAVNFTFCLPMGAAIRWLISRNE
jgi:hypothetical protein